jgi:leader peptidase (prepilin peptidase)/N-methyltransferase
MSFLLSLYAFAIGAVVGSFLNVVIHRYPRGESVVFPPSHCPSCASAIRPRDNIPVLSYLILRGRCRACHSPISPRYPLVELANGLFCLAIFQRTGVSIGFLPVAAIVSMTIALIYIDAEIQILPDVIDLPGVAIGLIIGATASAGIYPRGLVLATSLLDSLIGAMSGALILLAVAFSYKVIRKIEGMGLGDVKMLGMIGACSGWRPLFAVLLLASVTGALTGIVILAIGRRSNLQFALPFGVFLGLAALIILFFGQQLFMWLPTLRLGG